MIGSHLLVGNKDNTFTKSQVSRPEIDGNKLSNSQTNDSDYRVMSMKLGIYMCVCVCVCVCVKQT